ncbi:MAG: hypothetical protein SLRJCFUN_001530 [Candidatus Fervidibacter sp.]|jgi:predicted nucleic acid-binding Zn ribbon protein
MSHPHLEGRAVEPVRNILEQFIGQFASPEWLKDVLQVKWRQIVGERLAKRTQVRQVKNGVVTIVASTPAIANDLQFHKDELRERIRQVAQFEPSDIRIRIGTVQPELSFRAQRWERQLERIVLSPHDRAVLERAVAPITDPSLRQQALQTFERLLKISLWKRRHGFKECPRCQVLYRGHRRLCPVCRAPLRRMAQHN